MEATNVTAVWMSGEFRESADAGANGFIRPSERPLFPRNAL